MFGKAEPGTRPIRRGACCSPCPRSLRSLAGSTPSGGDSPPMPSASAPPIGLARGKGEKPENKILRPKTSGGATARLALPGADPASRWKALGAPPSVLEALNGVDLAPAPKRRL